MLMLLQTERPEQVIHRVIAFGLNSFGFYDVTVDMELKLFDTRIRHCTVVLPWPLSSYDQLLTAEQMEWQTGGSKQSSAPGLAREIVKTGTRDKALAKEAFEAGFRSVFRDDDEVITVDGFEEWWAKKFIKTNCK